MVDVRGDVWRPLHGTTPAAVKSNKNQKWDLEDTDGSLLYYKLTLWAFGSEELKMQLSRNVI